MYLAKMLIPLLLFMLAACAPPTPISSDDSASTLRAAWHSLSLMDVRTRENFTFADFDGQTVYVEPMATWCTTCRAQLSNVRAAQSRVSADQFVFVAISVETSLSNEALAQYVADQGFDWIFAVATPEMLSALTEAFGRTITNPPTTPHFVIRPDGAMTELITGIQGPDSLVALLQG